MNPSITKSNRLQLLFSSFSFVKQHFWLLFGLGLVAAVGRVVQIGGFGTMPSWLNIIAEIIVETSRVLIFLFVLGIANIRRGFNHVKRLLTGKISWKGMWSTMIRKIRGQWAGLLLSFIGFVVITGAINMMIDQLAYQTCLLLSLKDRGILVLDSSEWTILLFFKNILVIPFTIVFETLLILWLSSTAWDRSTTVINQAR